MDCYDWKMRFGIPSDFQNKKDIALECLEIANEAKFPTDYNDIFSHLFGNEDYLICMAFDKNNQLGGFSVFAKLEKIDTLYVHGIILHPRAQGKGLSLKMIETAIQNSNVTFISARTHNPRAFEALSKFACSPNSYYPNVDNILIPKRIIELVKNNPFTCGTDELLIVRNAYPDEKISQSVRNKKIYNIFKYLNTRDAQVIVVKVK